MLNKEQTGILNINPYQTYALGAKVTSVLGNNAYKELNQFRSDFSAAEIGPYHQIYQKHQKSALIYKLIFSGIGLFFLSMLIYVGFQKTNWICNDFVAGCFLAKTGLYTICSIFSTAAFFFAARINAQKEAVQHLMRMAKQKLSLVYKRRLSRIGLKGIFVFCENYKDVADLRHEYHEIMDKMHESRDSTLTLLSHISKADEMEKDQRITLYNQALLELRDKLNTQIALLK